MLQKIRLLLNKAEWIYERFPSGQQYMQKYQEYRELFDESLSFDLFCQTVLDRESQNDLNVANQAHVMGR